MTLRSVGSFPVHLTPGGAAAEHRAVRTLRGMPSPPTGSALRQSGVAHGIAAYVIWGSFPLYFRLLDASGAVEIVLHRVVWSLVFCLVLTRVLRAPMPPVRQPRKLILPGIAAFVLALNWGTYIYGVNSGQVVETSLGYFVNPLVTVGLGVVVLRERLRPAQWVAMAVGTVAVVVLTADYGRPPWIALTLAVSFGIYGLIKNRVGRTTGPVSGLTTETLVLAPVALAGLSAFQASGDSTFAVDPPVQALLLVSLGIATVVPLLLFASAAQKVPLSTIGLLQYLAPALQLLAGVVVLGERMPTSRWIGFGIVWVALAILTWDSLRHAQKRRHAAAAAPSPAPGSVPAAAANVR